MVVDLHEAEGGRQAEGRELPKPAQAPHLPVVVKCRIGCQRQPVPEQFACRAITPRVHAHANTGRHQDGQAEREGDGPCQGGASQVNKRVRFYPQVKVLLALWSPLGLPRRQEREAAVLA